MAQSYLLRSVSLFAHITDDELNALASEFVSQTVHKGQIIFNQGSTTSSLYIVRSGVIKITSFGRNREITYVAMRESGEFFGEFSVLDGLPRSGLAVAETNSELLVLTRPALFRFLELHPSVAIRLLVNVSRRLRFALAATDVLMPVNPHAKIANMLIELAERYSADDSLNDKSVKLGLRMRSEDLAAIAGTTTELASAVMDEFQQAELITVERAHVVAVNILGLRDYIKVMDT
ncbi:MAG: Crp/Fnr family transcriptional regulator [Anaerolineae bacterium]|nr:Crp/Fnr family transcriptional regulator [Anaerolineae bacterium]